MLFLLLAIFSIASSKFVSTKNIYNGTITYDGLLRACDTEFPKSKPCTSVSLLNGFWKSSLPPSWILTLYNNCLGYTTASSEVLGTCVVTSFLSITDCSCNMNIPICCTYL